MPSLGGDAIARCAVELKRERVPRNKFNWKRLVKSSLFRFKRELWNQWLKALGNPTLTCRCFWWRWKRIASNYHLSTFTNKSIQREIMSSFLVTCNFWRAVPQIRGQNLTTEIWELSLIITLERTTRNVHVAQLLYAKTEWTPSI